MHANDNIDINEETLDGKVTFYASQTAAFRRSKPEEEIPKIMLKSGRSKSPRFTSAACYEDLVLKVGEVQDILAEFDKANEDKPTFTFWRQYMDLVSILLAFTQALRCGDWKLYMSAFKSMMPWFAAYDHTHYTRWGAVFIADMENLAQTAPRVYQGFLDGDFVAREAKHSFNKMPFDLCLEHINKTGKVAGGLVGIT